MKRFLLNVVKFTIILLVLFLLIFLGMILVYTSNEISAGDFSRSSMIQVFLLALYNASFLAIIIYCVFSIANVTRYRLITLLIPVVITTIFVAISTLCINTDNLPDKIMLSDDARIYFSSQSFLSYKHDLNGAFSERDFEDNILSRITDDKSRNYIKSQFVCDNKSYYLKQNLLDYNYDKVYDILYHIGYYDNVKYYFDDINKNVIGKAMIIHNGKTTFYKDLPVTYNDRYITVQSESGDMTMTFDRERVIASNVKHSAAGDIITDRIKSFAYYWITPSSIVCRILLWMSYAYLIMSIFSIVVFKSYRFIYFIVTTIETLLCYLVTPKLLTLYGVIMRLPIHNELFASLIISGLIITVGTLIMLLNIFGIKSGVWERQ